MLNHVAGERVMVDAGQRRRDDSSDQEETAHESPDTSHASQFWLTLPHLIPHARVAEAILRGSVIIAGPHTTDAHAYGQSARPPLRSRSASDDVHDREHDHPDDIHEMPIQGQHIGALRMLSLDISEECEHHYE
jgi:hypothetical protein